MKARAVIQNKTAPDFKPQTVNTDRSLQVVLSRELLFAGLTEFEQKFGRRAQDIPQMEVVEITNEHGQAERGVLLADETQPFRKLTLSLATSSNVTTCLHSPGKQFRANQGEDAFKYVQGEQVKQQKLLRAAAPNERQIQAWIAALGAAAEQPRVMAPPAPATAPLASTSDETSSADEAVDNLGGGSNLLGSAFGDAAAKSKGQGKGKSRGRQMAGSKKRPLSGGAGEPSRVTGSVVDGEAASFVGSERSRSPARSSVAGSAVTRRHRLSPHGKLSEQAQKYVETLNIAEIAAGASCGKQIFQATRVQSALMGCAPESVDVVQLSAHVELAKKAEKIAPCKVWGHAKTIRQELFKDVCSQLACFPDELRKTLCIAAVRDQGIPSTQADVAEWLRIVMPHAADPGFVGF